MDPPRLAGGSTHWGRVGRVHFRTGPPATARTRSGGGAAAAAKDPRHGNPESIEPTPRAGGARRTEKPVKSKKISLLAGTAVLLLLPAVGYFGRNVLTGAAVTALFSSSHVHSSQGERTAAEKVPSSFMPSTYLRATSVTWTSWNDDAATGYARISTAFPGEVFSAGHRVRMELSCPVSHDGTTYFGRYDIEWLDDPPATGMDGWEQEGPITVLPGCD